LGFSVKSPSQSSSLLSLCSAYLDSARRARLDCCGPPLLRELSLASSGCPSSVELSSLLGRFLARDPLVLVALRVAFLFGLALLPKPSSA
jgi:hypothetical protein